MSGPSPEELGIAVYDKIGAHACKCMRRIGEIGVDAFLETEMANPTRHDEEWAELIVHWAEQRQEARDRGWPATRTR